MSGITVVYPHNGLKANDGVNFTVKAGEIHALVGENGAGKTTLMRVLYGLLSPDQGEIILDGEICQFNHPHEAAERGIGMVPQHFKLIPEFTVAQNVVLGNEPRKGIFFNQKKAVRQVAKVIEEHHFHLDPTALVSSLSVSQQQQVEILKVLYRQADILILDEPTAVLTEQEVKGLFKTLRTLQSRGKTIILITHKLAEVMAISQNVSVLRKGSMVAVRKTADTDRRELSRIMVGREVLFELSKEDQPPGKEVFAVHDASLFHGKQEKPLLKNISLNVHKGEILGVTAVAGNGLKELEDITSGVEALSEGTITFHGKDLGHWCCNDLRHERFAYVPSDRLHRGSSLESTVSENMIVADHHSFLSPFGGFDKEGVSDFVQTRLKDFDVPVPPKTPIGTLSGGNIQRVVLARELGHSREFVLFAEPTWGLDVASSEYVCKRILNLRREGTGVLMLSSNLDEVLGLADRVAVLFHGRVVAVLNNNPKLDKSLVGEYMLGLKDDFADIQKDKEGDLGSVHAEN